MTTQGVTKPENYRRITLTVDQFYAQAAERIYGRLACKQHASMQAVWDAAPSRYLRALAVEDDVVALPTLWRFALWCIRRHWILLRTEERRNFVDLVELYVDGKIDVLDVCDAWRDLNEPPVPDQTSAQLRADKAVEQLAGAAACINNGVDYARNRLCNVAKETEEAVEDSMQDAEVEAQAQWLRANAKPCFDRWECLCCGHVRRIPESESTETGGNE